MLLKLDRQVVSSYPTAILRSQMTVARRTPNDLHNILTKKNLLWVQFIGQMVSSQNKNTLF